ncbi:MAG: hypothetical protein QUS14_11215 [Pyrinomonadaceae bacterium]|nr:hypothetical protein [Pyrinomonadaceae bacterium]
MSFNEDSAVKKAKQDLAERLGVSESEVRLSSVENREFPDMSLGAPARDEMAAQMIASGWKIVLENGGKNYEYRADKYQLRLKDYKGENHVVVY